MFAFIHRSYLGGSEGMTDTDEKKHHRGGMDRAHGTVLRGGGDGNRMVEEGKVCECVRERNQCVRRGSVT